MAFSLIVRNVLTYLSTKIDSLFLSDIYKMYWLMHKIICFRDYASPCFLLHKGFNFEPLIYIYTLLDRFVVGLPSGLFLNSDFLFMLLYSCPFRASVKCLGGRVRRNTFLKLKSRALLMRAIQVKYVFKPNHSLT